jgi:hypothetical protein
MEARSSETKVPVFKNIRRHILEYRSPNIYRRQILKLQCRGLAVGIRMSAGIQWNLNM